MTAASEVAAHLYAHWNDDELGRVSDLVDPAVELVCDPLRPDQSTLRGIEGWTEWVARWQDGYESMRVTVDGLIPVGSEHVLALVSISATPRGGNHELTWAAAHVWTIRAGRITRWETHLDLTLAAGTLR